MACETTVALLAFYAVNVLANAGLHSISRVAIDFLYLIRFVVDTHVANDLLPLAQLKQNPKTCQCCCIFESLAVEARMKQCGPACYVDLLL